MTAYKLSYLAPGSYDVVLNGNIIASAVRAGSRETPTWIVELLDEVSPEQRPAPFIEIEHRFGTLDAVRRWLGVSTGGVELPSEAEVSETGSPRAAHAVSG